MKITIKNQDIELKSTMRSILIYEKITDKIFAPASISDMLVYFYAVVLASKKGLELTLDELIDMVDEDPTLFEKFNLWLTENSERNKLLTNDTSKKKKVSE